MTLPLAVFPGLRAPYDQPKAWWLQAIVVVTALVFFLERAQRAGPSSTGSGDRPLSVVRWLLAAYALCWVLATALSVAPGQSLLGSFERGFGLLTLLAALALFPLTQSSCTTADARRSVIDAALMGSVPVCLLALGQAIGWDRLPPTFGSVTTSVRVHSTFGQHLFLGSYLVLLAPLAGARGLFCATARVSPVALLAWSVWVAVVLALVQLGSSVRLIWLLVPLWGVVGAMAWDRMGRAAGSDPGRGVKAATLFGALLALQAVVVFLSGGRSPFVAMLVALAIVGVTLWRRRAAPAMRAVGTSALVILVGVGVVLAAAGLRGSGLRAVPVTERLAMPSGSEPRESLDDRLDIWAAVVSNVGRQLAGTEVMLEQDPRLRSAVGYGPDTQGFLLDLLLTARRGAQYSARGVRFVYDRAHDVVLDHLIAGGLAAAGIWIAFLVSILVLGVRRLQADVDLDWTLRVGCLGAVVAHIVEGITGIETIAPFALFWILSAMLTAAPRQSAHRARPRALWIGGLVVVAAVGCFAVAATTVWLMGSMSYARGVALVRANRFAEARVELEHAARLVPWLPAPRGTAGEAALRIAGLEADPARRAAAIKRIEMLLATPRGGSAVSADLWLVKGQVALTRARDGEPQQRAPALTAFERADRLRPNDIRILTPWALTLLIDNQPARARALAERVVRMDDEEWLAWAVIARASARLGDQPREQEADAEAKRRVPPEHARFLDELRRQL